MRTLLEEAPVGRAPSEAARAFRTLLTHVSADLQEAPRLKAAAALARKFDATLFGAGCATAPSMVAMDPTGLMQTDWVVAMRDVVRDDIARAHQLFLSETHLLKTDWAKAEDRPTDVIARLSRAADLIVAGGAPGPVEHSRSVDTGELVLRAGRPVLVVPPSGGELSARAIVVAWKDTREARRAISDALPFLRSAERVRVVDVCSETEATSVEVVVRTLARHNVNAQAKVVFAPNDRAAYELNVAAHAVGADLIVAGAYGHSRLGEWFFGGVTRDLLHAHERFLLLSH